MIVLGQKTNGKFELQAVLEDSDIKLEAIDVNSFLDSIKIKNLNTLNRNMLNCEMKYMLADGTRIQFLRFDKGQWVISEWDYRDDYDSKYHSLINSRLMAIYVELKSKLNQVE